MNAMTACCHFW